MTQQTNMTAVEWLVEKLMKGEFINNPNELIEQAKQMEKEQIGSAFLEGMDYYMEYDKDADKYYNETYGSKNDDHVERHLEMVSFKTEISDEEILIGLKDSWGDYEYDNGNLYSTTYRDGWVNAIKWYREQLKKK